MTKHTRESLIEMYEKEINAIENSIRMYKVEKIIYEKFLKELKEADFSFPTPVPVGPDYSYGAKSGVGGNDYETTV